MSPTCPPLSSYGNISICQISLLVVVHFRSLLSLLFCLLSKAFFFFQKQFSHFFGSLFSFRALKVWKWKYNGRLLGSLQQFGILLPSCRRGCFPAALSLSSEWILECLQQKKIQFLLFERTSAQNRQTKVPSTPFLSFVRSSDKRVNTEQQQQRLAF